MAFYDWIFDGLGLRGWCDGSGQQSIVSLNQLLAKTGSQTADGPLFPFPSLDELHSACARLWQTRDLTAGVESGFLAMKGGLKLVLDPLTQPLSWALDGALALFSAIPWWVMIPVLVLLAQRVTRSWGMAALVAATFLFFAAIDHFDAAIQTLSIVFVCSILSVLIGVPTGILMAKSNAVQRVALPVLDLLQTLPTFVYLIPLIFLFSVTESKLYGIAIILYAVVPIIRMTDLGVRLVDPAVIEAADAFGMSPRQKLFGVELPLALPNIMAGLNQTIMMSLAMVVIASLVSAPGLGVLVLRGIRNLDLGVGMIAGLGIVLLAIVLDRTSKAALDRLNTGQRH
ncbi:MAG: ABC transporter permease subunit [Paracoccaceae bacterium]|nr:ABC transporter permease subunit [Paracoccaceae bacterium]